MKSLSTKIKKMIYEIGGQKVMLDSDLASLYEVETKVLNQAVKRNMERFPKDFMFQLTAEEWEDLRSQFVTSSLRSQTVISKDARGGRRYMPHVFTEHGILMLSSVLNSPKAVEVNIQIMRTFVNMRQFAYSLPDTNKQIEELRKLLLLYIEKNDKRVNNIMIALNSLMEQPKPAKRIGFTADK